MCDDDLWQTDGDDLWQTGGNDLWQTVDADLGSKGSWKVWK